MGGYYTVVQGDHLSKIAKENGFPDYHIIWDHPNNADLKQKRKNPNVLNPGDQVFVPDMEQKEEPGSTEKRHTFVVNAEPLKLRLVLEDMYEKPIANAPCALLVEGEIMKEPTSTSPIGLIASEIPRDAHDGGLVLRGDETPFRDVLIPVKIGDLDSEDTLSGQVARLNNLGYLPGDGTDPDAFKSAVEEFQCDHHPPLKIDGICGDKTQKELKKVHGC
jgi:N-acetylmuramoyl-L-alanine amidase